jgi:hypothetical protein
MTQILQAKEWTVLMLAARQSAQLLYLQILIFQAETFMYMELTNA